MNCGNVDVALLDRQIKTFAKLIDEDNPDFELEGMYELLATIWEALEYNDEILLYRDNGEHVDDIGVPLAAEMD